MQPAVCVESAKQPAEPILASELGDKAGAQYHGDGLSVSPTPEGARLRCVFQRLEGQVTSEGLWLTSTVEPQTGEKFRVLARAIGRNQGARTAESAGFERCGQELADSAVRAPGKSSQAVRMLGDGSVMTALPPHGTVTVADKLVRCVRPGLTEEYSVSVDGVRQDFVVTERPTGSGDLCVELALAGARAEAAAYGAKLTLDHSQRALAYSRLHVVDAAGKELTARMEVVSADRLAVHVADADASYPVRIDPCFSDANWVGNLSPLNGANAAVNATVVDGSGKVYFGGNFTAIGTVGTYYIASWDGANWSDLGADFNDVVTSLVVIETNVYAGGAFTKSGTSSTSRIAKWDGIAWSQVGAGLDSSVLTLCTDGTNLYAGGNFTIAYNSGPTPITVNRVAKWDGSAWMALGSGVNNSVSALNWGGTALYAGGAFTTVTNPGPAALQANYIAKWAGGVWSTLGSGMNSFVSALVGGDNKLYAGGSFTLATNPGPSTVAANRIALWNGTSWSQVGLGLNGSVSVLVTNGNDLYAGGAFTTASNSGPSTVTVNRIAKWNETSSLWSALGAGMSAAVSALAMSGTTLFAGGDFTTAGGVAALRVARFSSGSWLAFSSGINGTVRALAVDGTNVYVGGDFTLVTGGVSASRVAKWNGIAWSALGSGISGGVASVRALAVIGNNVYVGGLFTTAGGVLRLGLAKWNTVSSSWSSLAGGINGDVESFAIRGTDLYVGGDFSFATNTGPPAVKANRIAKWDTLSSTWLALGPGLTNSAGGAYVAALAVMNDTNVFAGGVFTKAGSLTVNNIARWDTTTLSWSALGSGMSGPGTGPVFALAVSDTNLYAGGDFTAAGPTTAFRIAKWNGSHWSPLGDGMNSTVYSLAVNTNGVFAGGSFTGAGVINTNLSSFFRIGKWDGFRWSSLGHGMDGFVYALATDASSNLFVGGSFTRAGSGDYSTHGYGPASAYLAQAKTCHEIIIGSEIAVEQPADVDLVRGGSRSFGNVEIGATNTLDFIIMNLGNAPLTGLDLYTTNTSSWTNNFTYTAIPGTLAPGESASFSIAFAPTNQGLKSIWFRIPNNDPDENPYYDFNLTGTGLAPAPEIVVEQPPGVVLVDGTSTVPFGSVNIGAVADLTFTIKNIGHADLTGLNPTINGTDAARFSVMVFPAASVSGPSGSTTFTVRFEPTAVGNRTAVLHIASNDADENPFDITLTGTGPLPTLSPVPDQTTIARSATTASLTVPFQVTGAGTITPSVIQTPPPGVLIPPSFFFQITALPPVFSGSGADRTVLLSYTIPTFSPIFSSGLFPTDVQVTLTITDDAAVPVSRNFIVHLIDTPDVDGISDAVENGAPNGGDGNGDGILDSTQLQVASLLSAATPPSYVTLAAGNGLRLVNVQALTPPLPMPAGASFPAGLLQFQLEGLATLGASVTVTQFFQAALPAGLTYYKYGPPSSGAPADYYAFTYAGPGTTGAEIIPAQNKIILHLKDGALGDNDWTENGVIVDPGGPALVAVERYTLSISLLSATQAQISWPVAAGDQVLQYADSLLQPITWQPDSHTIVTNDPVKTVTVDLTNGTRFYSLGAP